MTKRLFCTLIVQIGLAGCWFPALAQPVTRPVSGTADVATAWADMTVRVMTKAPKNTPTYGSRSLGYLGLTMYETVVHGSRKHRSVLPRLAPSVVLPRPLPNQPYCWELALNAGQAYMLRALYGYTGKMQPVDSLATAIHDTYAARLPSAVVDRSERFGRAIAARIFDWSMSDGGHEGYLRNFPKDYTRPDSIGPGRWQPPLVGQSRSKIPLHPYWGQNRTFSPANGQLPIPRPLTYSTDTTSNYYRQYKEVFDRNKTLTDADRSTVMWWGDDPSETCSPPGHSYNLATIAIRNSQAPLVKAAETYARVGMAVADAFICCWKTKYLYLVERPASFIKASVTPASQTAHWSPFFLEPPFPAFYSGHATQSAATAVVLTSLYGNAFAFTDDTHAQRPPANYFAPLASTEADEEESFIRRQLRYQPRHYTSFWSAALECADSRLMGGIHTRHDNEVGLAEGTKVARNINGLGWH